MKNINLYNNLRYKLHPNDSRKKYLYHYTSFKNAESILTSNSLSLGAFSQMNDPFEFLTINNPGLYFSGDYNKGVENSYEEHKNWVDGRNLKTRIVSFCEDVSGSILRRGWNLLNMWASYGQNQLGVCLVFDLESLKSNFLEYCRKDKDRSFVCRPVEYIDTDRISKIESEIWSIKKPKLEEIAFIKPLNFSNEQEFRFMLRDDKLTNTDPIKVPISSICAIILGSWIKYKSKDYNIINDIIKDQTMDIPILELNYRLFVNTLYYREYEESMIRKYLPIK